jgi:hypothetical protein
MSPAHGAAAVRVARPHTGGTVSGRICGEEVNSDRVSVVQAPATGTLSFTMRQGTGYLTVYVPSLIGPGRYEFSDVRTRWLRHEELVNRKTAVWGGTNATTHGQLTVTDITPSRFEGHVVVTLSAITAPRSMPTCDVQLSFTITTA